jgi:hypothetical protein
MPESLQNVPRQNLWRLAALILLFVAACAVQLVVVPAIVNFLGWE